LRTIAGIEPIRRYQDIRLEAGKSPKTINNELQTLAGILGLARLAGRNRNGHQKQSCVLGLLGRLSNDWH